VTNRIWTRIQNRSNLDAQNVYVRYYWADPSAGLPAAAWHLIPGTAGHPNPAGPLTVPAHGLIDAPYVEWVPTLADSHQCLLAIAYINDDYTDSNNVDPIVYPFDIPWENNVGQRNVTVINPAARGTRHSFSIRLMNPFPSQGSYKGRVETLLTQATHLPMLSPGKPINPPKIRLALNKRNKTTLVKANAKDRQSLAQRFPRLPMHPSEGLVAHKTLPELLFEKRKPHTLDLEINIPEDSKPGSIYYLHIMQRARNRLMGGYTVVITTKDQPKK
jgi:hypothetical protein